MYANKQINYVDFQMFLKLEISTQLNKQALHSLAGLNIPRAQCYHFFVDRVQFLFLFHAVWENVDINYGTTTKLLTFVQITSIYNWETERDEAQYTQPP